VRGRRRRGFGRRTLGTKVRSKEEKSFFKHILIRDKILVRGRELAM